MKDLILDYMISILEASALPQAERLSMLHEAISLWLEEHRLRTAEKNLYIEPTCADCGQPLTSDDVAAGETICLDCGAALLSMEIDDDNPLLATVRVRLE